MGFLQLHPSLRLAVLKQKACWEQFAGGIIVFRRKGLYDLSALGNVLKPRVNVRQGTVEHPLPLERCSHRSDLFPLVLCSCLVAKSVVVISILRILKNP